MTEPLKAGPSPVHERLRRLLFLVPYVARHPGLTVEELAAALAVKKDALLEDLDLLTMVGRPPFQPDDYIDIYVENDRVYVDLDQRLSAPPRFTAAEATALAAAAELIRPAAGDALSSALAKLEKVLPAGARDKFKDLGRKIDAAVDAPADVAPLTRGVIEHREVEFDYYSPARNQTERRSTKPLELFSRGGQWYLKAHDKRADEQRLFRVDRMAKVTLTDRTFDAGPVKPGSLPNPVGPGGEVEVKFSAVAAPYMVERFGAQATVQQDGSALVRVTADSEAWLVQWVLSFGGEAVVVRPEWARASVMKAVEALSARVGQARSRGK